MFHAETIDDGHFERAGPESMRFDFLPHFVREIVARIIIERHVGAFAREHFAKRSSDAPRPTGNKSPLSFK